MYKVHPDYHPTLSGPTPITLPYKSFSYIYAFFFFFLRPIGLTRVLCGPWNYLMEPGGFFRYTEDNDGPAPRSTNSQQFSREGRDL